MLSYYITQLFYQTTLLSSTKNSSQHAIFKIFIKSKDARVMYHTIYPGNVELVARNGFNYYSIFY